MSDEQPSGQPGFCGCGCGQRTTIAKRNRPELGHIKGEPTKFVHGHNANTKPFVGGMKVCTKCGNARPQTDFRRYQHSERGVRWQAMCQPCEQGEKVAARRLAGIQERQFGLPRKQPDPVENRRRVKEWRAKNPEKARRAAIRYYLRRRGVPLDTEARVYVEEVLAFDPCVYCGERPGSTMDHIEPVSRGGDSRWSNLAGACLECNSGKCDKSLLQYMLHRLEVRREA